MDKLNEDDNQANEFSSLKRHDNGGIASELNNNAISKPANKEQKFIKYYPGESLDDEIRSLSDSRLTQMSEGENSKCLRDETINIEEEDDMVSKIIDDLGMTNYQLKIILLGIFMCFSYGAEIVVVSLITRKLEKIWHLTDMKKASLGGALFYGFFFGALISGNLMNSKGRKFCFVLGSWIFLFFGISSAFSNEFYSFMFYRVGVGLGIGLIIPTTLTFLTEMSPSKFRGFNSNIIWIGLPMGELFMCYIAKLFPLDNKFSQQSNWTFIILFASVPIILNLFLINYIHESPRYAFNSNKMEEALTIVNEIREDDEQEPLTKEEKKKLVNFYRAHNFATNSQKKSSSLMKIFSPKYLITTLKLLSLTASISFLFFSLLYIIPELVGKTAENVNFHDLLRTVVYATVFEAFGILFAFIMEIKSIGRLGAFRISLAISFIFSFLCLVSEIQKSFYLFVLKGGVVVAHRVLFIYLPESYPTEIRAEALGVSQSLTKILGITAPIICQLLISVSIFSLFLVLTLACMLSAFISLLLKKETLGTKIN